MKHLSTILIAMFLVPLGCGQSAEARDVRDKATEALDAIGEYTEKELEGLATSLQSGWSELQAETAELRAEARARGQKLADSIVTAIAQAEAKAAEAKKKLAAAGEAGADNAKESLGHASRAFDEAKAAVAKAWQELRR